MLMKLNRKKIPEVNTGSMADIAFLLLIFFLVSTTLLQEKGLSLKLPPEPEDRSVMEVNDRNLFKILINSNNQYLVEDKTRSDLIGLRDEIKKFVLNGGEDPNLSDSPAKATVSIKANRGTDYRYFIEVLDEVKEAYYEIYGANVGISSQAYRELDLTREDQKMSYIKGKEGTPMNISIAQPNN